MALIADAGVEKNIWPSCNTIRGSRQRAPRFFPSSPASEMGGDDDRLRTRSTSTFSSRLRQIV